MRKILTSRLFRCLICVMLVCSMLVMLSPVKAKAEMVSGGLIAAGATGAVISLPAAIAIGATLICLGVMVDTVSQNPFAFQEIASQVESHLTTAGTFIKDGTVEMYRFVTETGEVAYYAAADFMEACRSYLFDSQIIATNVVVENPNASVAFPAEALSIAYGYRYAFFSYTQTVSGANTGWIDYVLVCSNESPIYVKVGGGYGYDIGCEVSSAIGYSYSSTLGWREFTGRCTRVNTSKQLIGSAYIGTADPAEYITDYEVTLGTVLSVPIDGTSARTWSDTYASRGLYIASGGSQNPDDGAEGNDGWKFLLPLTLVTGATLYAMSQADQWSGQTPQEFDDYTTQEELTVTPAPEIDDYPAFEIAPLPNPNPDPGTGTNPDPGTGTNPDPGTGTNPDSGTNPDVDPNPGTNTGSSSWTPPSDMGKFTLDLKQYFPFCIPFDLYAFFTCLNAEPVAPVIEWIIPLPGGKTYPFEIDLSAFDSVAQILRRMQLLLFCVGLAFKTRDLIKG